MRSTSNANTQQHVNKTTSSMFITMLIQLSVFIPLHRHICSVRLCKCDRRRQTLYFYAYTHFLLTDLKLEIHYTIFPKYNNIFKKWSHVYFYLQIHKLKGVTADKHTNVQTHLIIRCVSVWKCMSLRVRLLQM